MSASTDKEQAKQASAEQRILQQAQRNKRSPPENDQGAMQAGAPLTGGMAPV